LKASHRSSDSKHALLDPGRPYKASFKIPNKSWKVEMGHQLRPNVTSADPATAAAPFDNVANLTGPEASFVDFFLIEDPTR
jgi:X-Pro dipeptidyl-peptidase C-terminal non-catalytic domain